MVSGSATLWPPRTMSVPSPMAASSALPGSTAMVARGVAESETAARTLTGQAFTLTVNTWLAWTLETPGATRRCV